MGISGKPPRREAQHPHGSAWDRLLHLIPAKKGGAQGSTEFIHPKPARYLYPILLLSLELPPCSHTMSPLHFPTLLWEKSRGNPKKKPQPLPEEQEVKTLGTLLVSRAGRAEAPGRVRMSGIPMFGLVFSAFPKPPNTLHIPTEVLPTLMPPPSSHWLCPSWWHPPGSLSQWAHRAIGLGKS